MELTNTNETIKLKEHIIDMNLELKKPNTFEEIVDENYTNTLVQTILSLEQVIDNNEKSLTMVFGKGFQPLKLFYDAHFENYNFATLFYGHPRPSLAWFYQKIVQA
jgi:hypothetical protein